MTPVDFVLEVVLGAFNFNLELIALISICLLLLFLTSVNGSKGLLFVALTTLVILFAVIVPAYGWVMWALILIAIGLIFVGLKVWFGRMV